MKIIYPVAAMFFVLCMLMTDNCLAQGAAGGKTGKEEFEVNCMACHQKGTNAINPAKPLKNSKKLADFETLLAWIRKPAAPMPVFPPSVVSEEQAKKLYDYIADASKKEWR